MNPSLAQALRCERPVRLALVGAGGKTTALFRLARDLITVNQNSHASPRVFVAASTHLAEVQCSLADFHFQVESEDDLRLLEPDLPQGVLLFTGSSHAAGRVSGVPLPVLDRLCRLSVARDCFLLIEADGSRRLPLKAPAAHEPALPEWVEAVVVCAGLSAIGKPLDSQWVHRPELFSRLAGTPLGHPIDPAALCAVLLHPQGGLKSIPTGARHIALLNQADTPQAQSIAHGMAANLLGGFHSVVIAALAPPREEQGSAMQGGVLAVHERVAGIVLAAGGSRRLGEPKQLLLWQGEPLIRHVARTAIQAGLQPLIVVTGAAAAQVEQALTGLPVLTVYNPNWEAGQSTSVQAGLGSIPAAAGAVIYLLADQPHTSTDLVRGLVELHAATLASLVAPEVQGQRGNPVLFDRRTFSDLLSLQGDEGGRSLFSRYQAAWLPWHDESVLLDIDTPQDYQSLLEG